MGFVENFWSDSQLLQFLASSNFSLQSRARELSATNLNILTGMMAKSTEIGHGHWTDTGYIDTYSEQIKHPHSYMDVDILNFNRTRHAANNIKDVLLVLVQIAFSISPSVVSFVV